MKEKIWQELRCLYCTKAQTNNENHKFYLDMVKGIAIILVVLGHSGTINNTINTWLSTFHLPAFFIVSGILMNAGKENQRPLLSNLKHKAKRLFIPFICFSIGTAFFILKDIYAGLLGWPVIQELVLKTVTLQGYSVMWFLPALFFAELYVMLLLKAFSRFCRRNALISALLCVVTTALAFLLYGCYKNTVVTSFSAIIVDEIRIFVKAFVASAFISYGYLLYDLFSLLDSGKELSRNKKIGYKFAELLAGVVLIVVNIVITPKIQLMDLNNLNLGALGQYLLLGVTGSLGLLLLCRNIPNIPLLSYYGQNSLIIMCTHVNFYILYVGLVLGQYFAAYMPGNYAVLWCLSSITCGMLLEIPLIFIIKTFFPFVLGKKKTKTSK